MSARFTVKEQWDRYRKLPEQDMYDYSPFLRKSARGNILEIGVCQGVSTAAFLLGLDDKAYGDPKAPGHLWSIDLDAKCGNLYDHPRWTFIHGDSWKIPLKTLPELDLLFVDGDHSYKTALSDLKRFSSLVVPGGTIMMHDVEPSEEWLPRIQAENWYPVEECARAWHDFCSVHPTWESRVMPGQTGLGVIVKGEK
jgi:predicted O-methyltransferase YrrM